MDDPQSVLEFWLGEVSPEAWYVADPDLDDEVRERFGDLWEAALQGGLEHWPNGTVGTLAYLIVCDQFSRNIWRGRARAFATDPQARAAARRALDHGWDMAAPEPERGFFYLPFEHSEYPDDQALSVHLFRERMPETGAESLLHAEAHEAIIHRFGRFPFRNAALGRDMTLEEQEFMDQGGYAGFVERFRTTPTLRVVD
ncbi:DUF924 family protein [Falsirhodobacter algicola]|uniref:DUF924 family protein n=1 Tax=Falsirhodobacter algicola TaxID=2692330 RepID=A0A8J8SK57_9RHOB|nr:DUF924 family protein [Falsirhodobacter algicola]QUS35530.1 DUF924 family protein [Falsirhodobacter algicola]